jgi:hypothetical protein
MVDAPPAPTDAVAAVEEEIGHQELPRGVDPIEQGRKRFTIAVCVGQLVAAIPYFWVLTVLWTGTISQFRTVAPGGFYDLQGRAILHGHLWVRTTSLGIEGFVHDGRTYTYFGVFPSLLRLPILLVTQNLDGRMTAPSIALAWLITGLFTSLLLWRIRILMHGGSRPVGVGEAVSYGIFTAALGAGSVLIYLAATPFVYDEDFAWSVGLAVAALFALLGVMERPSARRVLLAGVFILGTNLNRTTTGYACVIGALLVAGWFALGKGGAANRRWAWPVVIAGLVPLAVNCLVTYLKFGTFFGLPIAEQIWDQVNAHRRYFLAANGGKFIGPQFLPTTIVAYMQPFGLHFTSAFPFISLPTSPARAYAGAVLDQSFPTASIPSSMPFLFLSGCWGLVTAFRPRPMGRIGLTRVLLVAAASASAGVLVWGYIANRYLADFLPFFILAASIGLVDIMRRLVGRTSAFRRTGIAVIALVALFSIAANVAIAIAPNAQFTPSQARAFVSKQYSLTPGALQSNVRRGTVLPYFAPSGIVFIAGDCDAMYWSTGTSFATVPGQQIQHMTWIPVVESPANQHDLRLKFSSRLKKQVPLLTYGTATIFLRPTPNNTAEVLIEQPGANSIPWPYSIGSPFGIPKRGKVTLTVVTDPVAHALRVSVDDSTVLSHYLAGRGPADIKSTGANGTARTGVEISNAPVPDERSGMALCRSVAAGR